MLENLAKINGTNLNEAWVSTFWVWSSVRLRSQGHLSAPNPAGKDSRDVCIVWQNPGLANVDASYIIFIVAGFPPLI